MTLIEAKQQTQDCPAPEGAVFSMALEQEAAARMDNRQSDAQLVAAVGAGRVSALSELMRRHEDKVLALAFRTLGRWDQAEDVAQEAFLRVHRSARTFRPRAKVTTWLYRITVNLCLDHLRRAKRAPLAMSDHTVVPAVESPDALEADERAAMVRRAVADLPDRQRTALTLHRYQGLSHREITDATGWSPKAVESLLVRAYATLRESLAELSE